MKKVLFISFLTIWSISIFAQIGQGKSLISVNGSYRKEVTGGGTNSNSNINQGKYLGLGLSIGYFFTDHFAMGVGLNYGWVNEHRLTNLYFNDNIQQESLDIKSRTLLPSVYFGLYYPLLGKLYLNTICQISMGKNSVQTESYMVRASIPSTGNTLTGISNLAASGNTIETKSDVFSTTLGPEIVYFISSKIGLSLSLGGIYYTTTNWKSDYSSCGIDFAPRNWQVGFKISL